MDQSQAVVLDDLVEEHLERARTATAGRSASTLHGGRTHRLRQTLVALAAGRSLGEHESPGEATLQVLRGRVHLHAGDATWSGGPGELVVRHRPEVRLARRLSRRCWLVLVAR